jgi:hypothetical protein
MRKRIFMTLVMLSATTFSFSPSLTVRSNAAKDKDTSLVRAIVGANDDGFIAGQVVTGATATLQRSDDGLKVNIHTSDLPPGAYTIWWAVYNYPENCAGTCGFDDDFTPAVGAFWVNGTGKVISNGDHANFVAHLDIDGPFGEILVAGPGLVNPGGAEVQLVVRYHGAAIPGIIEEQTSTFLGGCPDGGPPCQDRQLIVFQP